MKIEVRHSYFIAIVIAVSVTISSKEESFILHKESFILHKDARSALSRAKSSKCRDNIKKIARQAQQKELYPQNIKPFCDFYQRYAALSIFRSDARARAHAKSERRLFPRFQKAIAYFNTNTFSYGYGCSTYLKISIYSSTHFKFMKIAIVQEL